MRNQSFNNPKLQAGASAMEAIIWIAIAAAVLAVVMYFGRQVFDAQKVSSEVQYFGSMLSDAKKKFQGQGDFVGVTPTVLIQSGAVPPKMIAGAAIRSTWGSAIAVAAANYNSGTGNAIAFNYSVPVGACSDFASASAAMVSLATVGGTVVKDVAAGNSRVDVPALNAACAAGTANVAVVLTDSI